MTTVVSVKELKEFYTAKENHVWEERKPGRGGEGEF